MAIFNINIQNKENANLYNQLLYFITFVIIFNILMTIGYSDNEINLVKIFSNGIFNNDFINIFMFIILGIICYNLIIKKIILFI